MEAVYRRDTAGRQQTRRTKSSQRGERRRLVQLIVCLCLFLVVFFGHEAFPAALDSWNERLKADTDFQAAFAGLGEAGERGGSLRSAIGRLSGELFGEAAAPEGSPAIPTENVRIVPLSQTERCGLQYVRENSFLKDLPVYPAAVITSESPQQEAVPEKEPEIVTAVAQLYSPEGETLPKKVSFQFYELGLDKTVSPVMGPVTSEFGYRIGPISGEREFHLAVDIAAAEGTEILAFAGGTVRYIGKNDSFGLYLMIDHDNGVATFYAHCSKLLVRKGDPITCGQTVALVGETGNATGPHLHFTLSKDDIRLDPAYYVEPEKTTRD